MTLECIVSDKFGFICVLLPGNATQALKAELQHPRFDSRICRWTDISTVEREHSFKFCLIQDPVRRFLSLNGVSSTDSFDQSVNRALDEQASGGGVRIAPQVDLLNGLTIDFFGSVEWMHKDMACLYEQLLIGHDSRFEAERPCYFADEDQLAAATVERITRRFQRDLNFFRRHVIDRYVNDGNLLRAFRKLNACRSNRLVYHLEDRGFFAEITAVARAMIYALDHGRRLELEGGAFSYRNRHGWQDYFRPFCNEYGSGRAEGGTLHCLRKAPRPTSVFREVRSYSPRSVVIDGLVLRDMQFILGVFLRTIFRLNDALIAEVDTARRHIRLPPGYAAIHIRRGDKVGDEDVYYPPECYWNRLVELGARDSPLFLLSDEFQAVSEMREWLRAQGIHNPVYTLCSPATSGFDIHAMRRHEECYASAESRQALSNTEFQRYMYRQAFTLVAEVQIAAGSEAFVGTFSSNVSRSIWYLKGNEDSFLLRPRDISRDSAPAPT